MNDVNIALWITFDRIGAALVAKIEPSRSPRVCGAVLLLILDSQRHDLPSLVHKTINRVRRMRSPAAAAHRRILQRL